MIDELIETAENKTEVVGYYLPTIIFEAFMSIFSCRWDTTKMYVSDFIDELTD